MRLVTDPTPGVPAAPVSADVPADEPVGTPAVEPEPQAPAEASAEPAPEPPAPEVPAEPVTPEVPGEPEVPAEPLTPEVPAEPVPPEVPAEPVTPQPAPPPVEPPTQPAAPTAPEPITPTPAAPDPVPTPPAEPVTPPEAPAAVDAGLAAAAAGTTEVAPDSYVPLDEAEVRAEPAGRRGALVGVAALVTLVVLGLGALTVKATSSARSEDRFAGRRADAVNEGRQLALNLVSLDYKTLDADLERISDSTTGEARQQFDERILSNDAYKKLVVENEAVITSKIQRIGLEQCGTEDAACKRGDTAVLLVFLDQESKNKLRTTPRVDRNRVALTLVRRGERWLVSKVEAY